MAVPFELTCSNYTTKIESDVLRRKFVYTMQSNQTFAAFAKIKKDVKEKPVPDVDKESLIYFEHDFKRSCTIDRVFNIDLKSAYASILYLDGFISADSYAYLGRLSKHDRLAAVGMLASRKHGFIFGRNGDVRSYEQKVSDLENFFFYAVKRTYEIMSTLRALIGNSYLFTWVDGIYFIPDMDALVRCENYLRRIKFRYSEEILSDWIVSVESSAVRISFLKEGQPKVFNLPARPTEFNLIMSEAMRDRGVKKNEFDIGSKEKRQKIFNHIKSNQK